MSRRNNQIATAFLGLLLAFLAWGGTAISQELQALARVDAARSKIVDEENGVTLELGLSQPVPWRVFALANPARIVLDFREVDWAGFDRQAVNRSKVVTDVRFGIFRPGWSRLVLGLADPMLPATAELRPNRTRGTAQLSLRLVATDAATFAAGASADPDDEWALPQANQSGDAKPRQLGDRPLVIVLDPGHGGIDPGAENAGHLEKDLVLMFARELQEALVRTGRYKVELTRSDDSFLSLPARITAARVRGADVFLSLHADAVSEGRASGTTVYTLSNKASDAMAEELAASHDRSDLLAGVDLSEQDDQIAGVLMDLARLETDQRSGMLAEMMVEGIADSVGRIRKRPHLSAGFTVLKAPDIPSVLLELGFISSRSDLNNLLTPEWRMKVVKGIIVSLDKWTIEDAAQARLLRK